MALFLQLEGLSDYRIVHQLQRDLVQARVAEQIDDVVLLLEHEPVITVGRRHSSAANVVSAGAVPVVEVERGGDVTWHGPGQLVAYPVLKLTGERADLHLHLRSLEDAVIGLLGDSGIHGVRDERNSGVWIAQTQGLPRKVCSVGIACRRWVSWHGLALNVTPDLSDFQRINPCGFEASIMTSMAAAGVARSVTELMPALATQLARELAVDLASYRRVGLGSVRASLGLD